ncbi:DEAD/DEAH box helicase [Rhodococcus sp. F64268]|uniref:DEAD/DEAH box helicase n=1 Tax=Rhodococcus sp. F64268 TaxID=2926402 RepID=UPI001FF4FEEF|nr:DEAD/DEAH box helicase [Rhodococcus sp. F64268]MCK0093741.1 DEAD/DEAH box helicase [Rhodococcus sp. F64268]
MERNDNKRLKAITDEVAGWVGLGDAIMSDRKKVEQSAEGAVRTLRKSFVSVSRDGAAVWRVLPLRAADGQLLGSVAQYEHLVPLAAADKQTFRLLATDIADASRDVRSGFGVRRFFSGGKKREAGRVAAEFLWNFHQWAISAGLPDLLARLSAQSGPPTSIDVSDALAEWVGLVPRLSDLGTNSDVLAVAAVVDLPDAIATIERALRDDAKYRAAAIDAGNEIRRAEARALLVEMNVDRLKDATRDRLVVNPLKEAGITTVQAVLDAGDRIERLPGIGPTSATRIRGAAQTLWQTTYDEMPARIDVKNRTSLTTELLRRLAAWDALRKVQGSTTDLARAEGFSGLARAIDRDVSHLVILAEHGASVTELKDDVAAVIRMAREISGSAGGAGSIDPWDDFLSRPADYFALLAELGFITEDEGKTHGDLSDEIIDAVRSLELDTKYLRASLRGYQSFAARFSIVQRKVIIGDEMGLGKTVEALAVLAHLRSKGAYHFLVVCPAAVVTNWVREVGSKSKLLPHRVHGPDRAAASRNWIRNGGVAVTTFETLAWFEAHAEKVEAIACVVVDEAHYIKNPAAQRSMRTTRMLGAADHAILLTGTPLENRIDEFRNLVGYLRPDLVVDATELAPRKFRKQVAPAYLRRNQEDVLTELPELVEVDEWLPLSTYDATAYRDAVAASNFMAMRQAAMLQGGQSEKVRRLIEIVAEAEENCRRVIVFSHFRGVLDQVVAALPGKVFGPLNGSVPAAARQAMVDQFSAAGHGALLVSQIVAGGVGLNIQAASVVVICEPQLKPTTEWQAIARARRMGQLESVQVHRLLSEEGVDQRITEILARKRAIFEDFARESDTAQSAPEAFDVSEAELARDVIAAERERLFSIPRPDVAAT